MDAGRSTSYVVAPVVLAGEVVGFFHADHAPGPRRSGMIDRSVLWTFAQGFSLAYERLVLANRVQLQRERLHAALGSAQALIATPGPALDLAWMPCEDGRLRAEEQDIGERAARTSRWTRNSLTAKARSSDCSPSARRTPRSPISWW